LSELALAHPRPTILLTGFGPFPGYDSNATTALIPAVADRARGQFPHYHVVDEVLCVEWSRAPRDLQRLLAGTKPVLALHFGVCANARGFQVELVGRNVRGARHDAAGKLPKGETVIPTGPAMLASTVPAERIIARLLRGGYPCSTSNNAGNYLCNALMYHSLAAARGQTAPFLSGFVHVPPSLPEAVPEGAKARGDKDAEVLTWTAAVAGTLEIIAACVERNVSVVTA
jgi:pyroglutamyl-peptidase